MTHHGRSCARRSDDKMHEYEFCVSHLRTIRNLVVPINTWFVLLYNNAHNATHLKPTKNPKFGKPNFKNPKSLFKYQMEECEVDPNLVQICQEVGVIASYLSPLTEVRRLQSEIPEGFIEGEETPQKSPRTTGNPFLSICREDTLEDSWDIISSAGHMAIAKAKEIFSTLVRSTDGNDTNNTSQKDTTGTRATYLSPWQMICRNPLIYVSRKFTLVILSDSSKSIANRSRWPSRLESSLMAVKQELWTIKDKGRRSCRCIPLKTRR